MYAYPEIYLYDFIECFGNMFQYSERDLGITLESFYDMFLQSRVARGVESGNTKYLLGMSGVEMARDVVYEKTRKYPIIEDTLYDDRGIAYWTGYVLAYYQWYRNVQFKMIDTLGLTIDVIRNMYILHEADITKFISAADKITGLDKGKGRALAYFRKIKNMSQKELADMSGVPLRMIQLYEQGQNDIGKANADYVMRISGALDVKVETLLAT